MYHHFSSSKIIVTLAFCILVLFSTVPITSAQTNQCQVQLIPPDSSSVTLGKDFQVNVSALNCQNQKIIILLKDKGNASKPAVQIDTFKPSQASESRVISKSIISSSEYEFIASIASQNGTLTQVGISEVLELKKPSQPAGNTGTPPPPASSQGNQTNPQGNQSNGNTTAPTVEQTDPNAVVGTFSPPTRFTSIGGLVVGIVNFALGLIGALAVLFIIIGGVRMVTSAGNETSIKAGKRTLTWAIIGLGVAMLAYTVITALETLLGRR